MKIQPRLIAILALGLILHGSCYAQVTIQELVENMPLDQKLGQFQQADASGVTSVKNIPDAIKGAIQEGRIGSFLNVGSVEIANELQRIAVEESEFGIPLLIGRDVIHGFRTIFPIPLGQAASWDAALVQKGASIAAKEASAAGINWVFAPMLDISRDPRWGRIAESFGEDPYLSSVLGAASVRGYQGDDLSDPESVAASAKHFLGYGAAEGGRDYNTTYIPEPLLHNIYLPPFKAAVDAGTATIMSAFNDLNGVPASLNRHLLTGILREELGFDGFVVSDWNSVTEGIIHGNAATAKEAAALAFNAGVDMEMVSTSYNDNLRSLLDSGVVTMATLNQRLENILRVKKRLDLSKRYQVDTARQASDILSAEHLAAARESAIASFVLLKNEENLLPINVGTEIALLGPLADAPHDQMGTWVFDGQKQDSVTVLTAFRKKFGDENIRYHPVLDSSRDRSTENFDAAVKAASKSDLVVMVLGEEASLSGEAQSRADIRLPGAQQALIRELKKTGKPLILIIMAGRPIALNDVIEDVDAILMAWHPGTMGGPAIADVISGDAEPGGRLPITWPKVVGQIPLYYNHKNTGRPHDAEAFIQMDDFPLESPQHSTGNRSQYIDVGFAPQFPFGFGLTYSDVTYSDVKISKGSLTPGASTEISAVVKNTGKRPVAELVQLYVRDLFGSVTRPVRELKQYKKVTLQPGESRRVAFSLHTDELKFFNSSVEEVLEPGDFKAWIAPNAAAGLMVNFEVVENKRSVTLARP
jgi:beta-glucosidase